MISWDEQMRKRRLLADNLEKQILAQITGQGRAMDNMVVDIVKRVRDKGENYKGESFKGYSSGFLLLRHGMAAQIGQGVYEAAMKEAKFFYNSSGKSGRVYAVLPGGYKRLRQIAGRQVDHKGFSFTGQMWKGFGVKEKIISEGNITIKMNAGTEQKKADWNSEREKVNIVKSSKEENKRFTETASKELTKLLNAI